MRRIMPAEALYLLGQACHKNEFQTQRLGHVLHTGFAKTRVATHQLEADVGGQTLHRLSQKLGRSVGARTVAPAQPVVGDEFVFGQRREQRSMTRLESLPGVTDGHALLMAVLVQQGPRIQIQRVTIFERGQAPNSLPVQIVQGVAGLLAKHLKEPAQGGLAGDGFDAQHLAQGRIALQPGHPGQFVCAAENAPNVAQRHIGRIICVGLVGLWGNTSRSRCRNRF